MPNKTDTKKVVTKPIQIIGPKIRNTQAFGTYASNRGGSRRRRLVAKAQTRKRIRK